MSIQFTTEEMQNVQDHNSLIKFEEAKNATAKILPAYLDEALVRRIDLLKGLTSAVAFEARITDKLNKASLNDPSFNSTQINELIVHAFGYAKELYTKTIDVNHHKLTK